MENRNIALDLLRATAILMVFVGHTVLSYGSPSHLSPLQFGGTGVDLFFVLSGWLIGYQLFKELGKFNNIDIKRFWVRRWMRTLPAYYVSTRSYAIYVIHTNSLAVCKQLLPKKNFIVYIVTTFNLSCLVRPKYNEPC